MSIRTEFADAITNHADIPPKWRVYPYGYVPDNATAPIIVVRQTSIARNKTRPRTVQDTGFTVALVEPAIDPRRVEDDLDADIDTLIDILETLAFPGLVWTGAQRVTFENRFHGYDVTVTITTEKE